MDRRSFLQAGAAAGAVATAGCLGRTSATGLLPPKRTYLTFAQDTQAQVGEAVSRSPPPPENVMKEKVNQAIDGLTTSGLGTEVYEAAINGGIEALFLSKVAVLPTLGVPETKSLFEEWLTLESSFEEALTTHIRSFGTEQSKATAAIGRNFLQVTTEAMQVIGKHTKQCDPANPEQCDLIRQPDRPISGDETVTTPPTPSTPEPTPSPNETIVKTPSPTPTETVVQSPSPTESPTETVVQSPSSSPESPTPTSQAGESPTPPKRSPTVSSPSGTSTSKVQSAESLPVIDITEGFHREVRSPFFMGRDISAVTTTPQEKVITTDALWPSQCQTIVKETKGTKVIVRPVRVPIWVEPWFARARIVGFKLIWIWEFVPAEFIKELIYCNEKGEITREVNTEIIVERKLMHFWRFFKSE